MIYGVQFARQPTVREINRTKAVVYCTEQRRAPTVKNLILRRRKWMTDFFIRMLYKRCYWA